MSLLEASELRNIQLVAESGMTSSVKVYRRTTAANAYGDAEDITYPYLLTTKGWLYSTPTPVAEVSGGQVVTVNTYRLFLPVGTNIRPGDKVVLGSESFVVSDTTNESTWPALLNVSLRQME